MLRYWVVYEANSIVPKLFISEQKAYDYRSKRQNRDRVRHQIYVQPAPVEDEDDYDN